MESKGDKFTMDPAKLGNKRLISRACTELHGGHRGRRFAARLLEPEIKKMTDIARLEELLCQAKGRSQENSPNRIFLMINARICELNGSQQAH